MRRQHQHSPGHLTQHDEFISMMHVFSWLMGCVPPYLAWLRTFWQFRSTLMPFNCSCMPIWPLGPVPRLDTFISSMCSFPSPLVGFWVLWRSPGTTALPSNMLGSSRSLLGEFIPSTCSEHVRLYSDALRSFFGWFLGFLTLPGGPTGVIYRLFDIMVVYLQCGWVGWASVWYIEVPVPHPNPNPIKLDPLKCTCVYFKHGAGC